MDPVELLLAGTIMVAVLVAGLVAHELSHALVLRGLGIECDVRVFPDGERATGGLESARGGLATVVPRLDPAPEPWRLRVAALAPLALVVPVVLVATGVVPAPVGGDPVAAGATVAWLACALPSPQDFSLVWYADRAIDDAA